MVAISSFVVAAALLAAAPAGGSVCTQDFDYVAWAATQTFQVGDTLVFDHGASASASADDATTCIARNPVNPRGKTLTLSAAGPWHFICPNGQALEIKVAAATATATASSPPASTPDHHAPQPWHYLLWKAVTSSLYYLVWTPVKVIGWGLYYLARAAWYVILSILYYFLWTPAKMLCRGLYYVARNVVSWILYYVAWTPSKAAGWGLYFVAWGAWKVVFSILCCFGFVLLNTLVRPVIGQCLEDLRGRWIELLKPVIQQKLESWWTYVYEKFTDG